ncbi:hypothetical protein CSKR_114444 [Clonorchis sinensis]|uniref:Uncharacterized protein n=1 Tax=Clonorchis sinensis TaxID=79923 RepID=A0A419PH28_CLOSI|nr:hypothetical protein CSKR_114444 [Clonorchis sinensis]
MMTFPDDPEMDLNMQYAARILGIVQLRRLDIRTLTRKSSSQTKFSAQIDMSTAERTRFPTRSNLTELTSLDI